MRFLIYILLIVFGIPCVAQDLTGYSKKSAKQFMQARQLYDNKEYTLSLEIINELIKKENNFIEAYLLKADVLHEMRLPDREATCLEQALKIDSIKYPTMYFALGNALRQNGEYAKAKSYFLRFIENAGNRPATVEKARKNVNDCDFALTLIDHAFDFVPVNLGDSINTSLDEYWPSLSLDSKTLVFTRLVPLMDTIMKRQFFQEDFFVSKFKNGSWTEAKPISSINTVNNEGAQAISQDASLLFFTACSRRDTWGGCDLYFSKNTGDSWSVPQNVGNLVNSAGWESQPSISANNEFLYFVSNRKGGKGGMDIWRCPLNGIENGIPHWGKAENLGDSINTPGNEMSPFIHPDGQTLYFSSDYWQGMGGNDIFFSKMKPDSSWTHPVNIGYPINTQHDERGLIVDASGETAFYSSNRNEQGMDIYSFQMPEKVRPMPVTYIRGTVLNAKSNNPVTTDIELVDLINPKKTTKMLANEKGSFFIGLPLGRKYMVNVSAPGYLFYSGHFALEDIKTAHDPFLLEIRLNPIEPGLRTTLNNVFFDTGSSKLLPESIAELKKLLEFLNSNPSVKIEIGGHTDKIGSEAYNMELSTKRAEAVYHFLIQNGIDKNRLQYQGYGFTQPVSTNETEDGKAANRRTEFKIIE